MVLAFCYLFNCKNILSNYDNTTFENANARILWHNMLLTAVITQIIHHSNIRHSIVCSIEEKLFSLSLKNWEHLKNNKFCSPFSSVNFCSRVYYAGIDQNNLYFLKYFVGILNQHLTKNQTMFIFSDYYKTYWNAATILARAVNLVYVQALVSFGGDPDLIPHLDEF